jgi:hypothetical protein
MALNLQAEAPFALLDGELFLPTILNEVAMPRTVNRY